MDISSIALSAIPWLVAIAGWVYATRQANIRELRKELRGDIESVVELIETINGRINDHHSDKDDDLDLAISRIDITAKLQTLISKTERLIRCCDNGRNAVEVNLCSQQLHEYFDRASGDHLDSSSRLSKKDLAELNLVLHNLGLSMESSLDAIFRSKFPIS